MAAPSRQSRARRRVEAGRIFGRNLRRICVVHNIDAARLVELSGRSRGAIERMLAGKADPTLSLLKHLARSIDVPVAELIRGL
jgi:transcriptional regulator with XRE-family HTH domain